MHEMSPSENLYGGQFTLNIYIKPNYPLPPDVAVQFMQKLNPFYLLLICLDSWPDY